MPTVCRLCHSVPPYFPFFAHIPTAARETTYQTQWAQSDSLLGMEAKEMAILIRMGRKLFFRSRS